MLQNVFYLNLLKRIGNSPLCFSRGFNWFWRLICHLWINHIIFKFNILLDFMVRKHAQIHWDEVIHFGYKIILKFQCFFYVD